MGLVHNKYADKIMTHACNSNSIGDNILDMVKNLSTV
jgi:hypothetical protein